MTTKSEREELLRRHKEVLDRALEIHIERTEDYGETWQGYGWRGSLFQIRAIVERSWDKLWQQKRTVNKVPEVDAGKARQMDAMLDIINYAVFTYLNIEDNNQNGTWIYPR